MQPQDGSASRFVQAGRGWRLETRNLSARSALRPLLEIFRCIVLATRASCCVRGASGQRLSWHPWDGPPPRPRALALTSAAPWSKRSGEFFHAFRLKTYRPPRLGHSYPSPYSEAQTVYCQIITDACTTMIRSTLAPTCNKLRNFAFSGPIDNIQVLSTACKLDISR